MDTAQWPQGIGLVKPMDHHHQHQDQISANTCNRPIGGERRATRPQEQLNCPRCNSTNTKFCYYNNYSLTQPRYFCKGCRRYWTEGGSLRNVPVGGGSRKNKRSTTNTSSSSSPTTSSFKLPDLNPPRSSLSSSMLHLHHQNPSHQGQDLNLSFQEHHHHHHPQHGSFLQPPKMENRDQESNQITQNPNSSASNCSSSALDLLRTGIASRGLSSFVPSPMPDSNTIYSSNGGFTLQEFKPASLSFPVGGHENGGRLFFPFGDFSKQVSESDQQKGQATNRYWNNGMLGNGGGSW